MTATRSAHPSKPRRRFLAAAVGTTAAVMASPLARTTAHGSPIPKELPASGKNQPAFRYCLNTSTINGSQVPVDQQLKIASQAGYDSVELWLRDIAKYEEQGGTIADLRKQLDALGLGLDSAIAFANWIVDDPGLRQAGLEQAKRDMDIVAALGGTRIAAPPAGGTKEPKLNLDDVAARYVELLKVGRASGVTPQIELWGFSRNLSTLAEVLYVAAAANDPDACVLLDVYHMYKGGSDFSNIGLVPGSKMFCLHINDYPNSPARPEISDQDRVYPGDGVAPLSMILQTLAAGGFQGTLSLELFNRTYWQQPPQQVADMGLQKTKAVVAAAFPAR